MSPAFSKFLCAAALAVLSAGVCDAAIISVPATGNLQSAIDKASPGDVIELAAGAIYTGNFVLPEKTNPTGAFIVITTAPSTALPGANVRVVPSQHAQHLAKLRSPNTEPALRTAPRARFWRSCSTLARRRRR